MRIIFLLQYYFGQAKLLYIPLNAISGMNFKNLGFLRGSQRAISLKYDNTSVIFLITYVQGHITGLGEPSETFDFYRLLKEKLPECSIDETNISTEYWDYYLSLAGLVIGSILGFSIGGFIGALLGIVLFGALGTIIGKILNKLTK